MAVEIDHSRPIANTKRLEGSLVAPRMHHPVPNHLTAIKSFVPGSSTGVLQTNPTVLHFSGYRVGHVHKQTLRVINASKDNQHMHIIPPSTPHFSIHYTKKKSRLVPGLSLDITVEFKPTEWKYYYDCIRIHCKDDHNLLVPIHAYPVMSRAKFPSHVRFPATPVGRTRNKTLSLECDVPIDFEFQLTIIQHHSAFITTPMRGVVPANGKVDVMVTFAPTEFSTAIMKLKLELSQFNSTPMVCTFSGSSIPGLDIESVGSSVQSNLPAKLTKSITLPPLRQSQTTDGGQLGKKDEKRVEKNTGKIKKKSKISGTSTREDRIKINSPAAANKLLTQRSSHKNIVSSTGHDRGGVMNRQSKQAKFLKKVRQTAEEERANRLRWVTQLGASVPTSTHMEVVLRDRSIATNMYLHQYCHKPQAGSELSHSHTQCLYRRTRRLANEHPSTTPKFDHYSNNTWQKRHRARQSFIRAARKILIQVRVQKRLEKIRRLVTCMKEGIEDVKLHFPGDDIEQLTIPLSLPVTNVLPLSFPKSTNHHDINTDMTSTKNPSFEVKPTVVRVKKQIPLMELKTPHQYQLLGYSAIMPPLMGTFINTGLPRPLKCGAEAELENLGHLPGVNSVFLSLSSPPTLMLSHAPTSTTHHPLTTHQPPLTVQDIESESERDKKTIIREAEYTTKKTNVVPLIPPSNQHHTQSHNVFNPCPGVLHYVPPLHHSEVTVDHALLPLPLIPSSSTHTHPPLHLQDYIPCLMHWKSFPSLWLVANESRRRDIQSQSSSQRMRDSFFGGLVSDVSEVDFLSGPQPDDDHLIDHQSCSELLSTPTLEMVRSQFHVPSLKSAKEHNKNTERSTDEDQQVSELGVRIQQRLNNAMTLFNENTDIGGGK